eukprot:gene6100-7763_t
MTRALREFRIRGVKTNIPFLINIVNHAEFKADRGTKTIQFLGNVIVNGNSDVPVKYDSRKFI